MKKSSPKTSPEPLSPPAASPPLTHSELRRLLRRHHLTADKRFGQHFLVNGEVLRSLLEATDPSTQDTVLEIGPGLGVLTRALAGRAGRVICVERDSRLLPLLNEVLEELSNVHLVPGDALTFDFSRLPSGSLFASNLPYNIATAIVRRALAASTFRRLVFMVQKEVAERLVARPGQPAFGALSLIIDYFGRARILRHVAPGCFHPPPEVTSSIVIIEVTHRGRVNSQLLDFLHQAFRYRRKTLQKSLIHSGYPKETVQAALAKLGHDPRVRAETLELSALTELHELLRYDLTS